MGGAKKRGLWAHKKKIAAIAAIALIGGGFAYGQNVAKKRAVTEATKNLVHMELERGDIVKTVAGTGTLVSEKEKEISVPVGTRIEKLYVESGDRVKEGDKIAKLSEISVKEQLLKIDLAIDSKKTEIDELDKKDDHYELKKEIATEQLNRLKEDREKLAEFSAKTVIKAPATGILTNLNLEEGDTVGSSAGSSDTGASSGSYEQELLKAFLNMSRGDDPGPEAYVKDIAMYTQSPSAESENSDESGTENEESFESETAGGSEESSHEEEISGSGSKSSLRAGDQNTETGSTGQENTSENSGGQDNAGKESETGENKETEEKIGPVAITFDSINLSIKAPVAGAAKQSSVSLDKDLHLVPSINWIGQDDGVLAAVVTLRAEEGYYIEGKAGEIKVKVDSCDNAVSASYDTNADGKIDTVVTVCPYVMNASSLEEGAEAALEDYARKQALEVLSELSKEYPKLKKEIDKEINSLEKQLKKASGKAISSIMGSTSDLTGGLSSLLGGTGTDLSALAGASSSASYNYQTAAIAKVVPVKDAFINISVDEMDINDVRVGQKAYVTVDALQDQLFEGEITEVAELSESDSGKYTVRLKLEKTDEMRFGMNASVEIEISRKNNVLVLPLEAIQTLEGKDVVYTESREDGTLISPVEIRAGISDGENAEITEGLEQGQSIYYFKVQNTYNPFSYGTEDGE